jgi:FdhD protein
LTGGDQVKATEKSTGPHGSIRRRAVEVVDVSSPPTTATIRRDALAAEEPLEIRVLDRDRLVPIAVTMRTPGADFELAAGFLFSEAILEDPAQIMSIRYCLGERTEGAVSYNAVNVVLAPAAQSDGALDIDIARRSFFATSSCGVCGKSSIDAVVATIRNAVAPGPTVAPGLIIALPAALKREQKVFARTGGLHAAALFDSAGGLISLHEDVGRHNALDKLIGEAWLAGSTPLHERIVLVSGRISFEVVQKAARAGVSFLAGVSAPSSLAIELAERFGMTVIGFLRNDRFNIYCGRERIADLPPPSRRQA